MLSPLSWEEYWPVPLLQNPESQSLFKQKGMYGVLAALPVTFQWQRDTKSYPLSLQPEATHASSNR